MKKILPLAALLCASWLANAQQNVGIGTNTPETKLQVNGAISFVPAEADAAALVIIPDNVSAFRLKLIAGGTTTALSVTNGKEGQVITIYNQDDNAATFAGSNIIATTGVSSFMFINNAWRLTASNSISGPQGPAGPQGAAGAQGPAGPQGAVGPQGSVGPAGAIGPQGNVGAAGAVGPQGPQGPQGNVGPAGAVGAQGSVGPAGAIGPQGPQGNVGAAGAAGAVGPQGPQGNVGPAGAVGAQGPQGNVGAAGAAGAVGPQGPAGPQGTAGAAGAQGPQGSVGPAGAVGPQGAQGPQGTAGLLPNGTAVGNTTYWNGSTWVVNNANLYNAGANIGIGTPSPGYKLDVSGDINFSSTVKFNGTNVIWNSAGDVYGNFRVIQSNSTLNDGMYLNYNSTGGAAADLRIYANGTNERMRILGSSGNVGIATSAPTAKLEVVGPATGSGPTIRASGGGDVVLNAGGSIFFDGNYSYAGGNYIRPIATNTQAFFTSGAERMRITSGGSVGIGTTGPVEQLHTTGNIRADGIVYWGNAQSRTESRDNAGLQGDAGAKSGLYETSAPAPASSWYPGASSWQHMIDVRHSNSGNNYAMQIAGSFFDQRLFFRKTNNSASTAWSEVVTVATDNTQTSNAAWTMAMHSQSSPDDLTAFAWTAAVDEGQFGVTMPFNIRINGTDYSTLSLSTNGVVMFGTTTQLASFLSVNAGVPSSLYSGPMLFWYGADMSTRYRSGTMGTAPNRTFIIDFDGNRFNTSDDVDGQIEIHEGSGLINVYYRVMEPNVNGQTSTIGFQLNGGASAKSYPISYNGKVFDDNNSQSNSWSVCPVR